MITTDELPSHLIKAVEAGVDGLDVLQGELKNLMLDTEQQMDPLDKSPDEMLELRGFMDALTSMYILSYKIQFAIEDWRKANGNN